MDPLQPGDPSEVGGYRLLGRLGSGGMGEVFLGRSPGGRQVAVKLIRRDHTGNEEFRRRFAREVDAARRVGGFHTAPVVDADPDADPPWMVTAYIPGPSLHDAVAASGPLAPRDVRALGAGLAEGLAAIHACGLVHRDLKPGNVILAADGPRIIDFGIARAADVTGMTAVGAVLGTYAYMSPEQVYGTPAGPASDVFALGSVLAFAAAGQAPFGAESVATLVHRITSEPPDLNAVPDAYGLRELLAACLAKDPADRPSLTDVMARLTRPVADDAEGHEGEAEAQGERSTPTVADAATTRTPSVAVLGAESGLRHAPAGERTEERPLPDRDPPPSRADGRPTLEPTLEPMTAPDRAVPATAVPPAPDRQPEGLPERQPERQDATATGRDLLILLGGLVCAAAGIAIYLGAVELLLLLAVFAVPVALFRARRPLAASPHRPLRLLGTATGAIGVIIIGLMLLTLYPVGLIGVGAVDGIVVERTGQAPHAHLQFGIPQLLAARFGVQFQSGEVLVGPDAHSYAGAGLLLAGITVAAVLAVYRGLKKRATTRRR